MAAGVIAGLVSVVWCFSALWIGPRLGFVDRPDRSNLTVHRRTAVPLGGVGIYIGLVVVLAGIGPMDVGLLVAASIVVILGAADDRWDLPPWLRLGVETIAAVVLVVTRSSGTDDLVFTVGGVVLTVALINAVNLYDGMDGLAGLTGLVTAVGFAVLASVSGDSSAVLPLAVAGALAGFLLFNWYPARVFLGDSGAYLLGLLFSAFAMGIGGGLVPGVLAATGLAGVFVIDLLASIIRRWRDGTALFAGDRLHVYDQLAARGWSAPKVAIVSALVQAVLVGFAIAAIAVFGAAVALLLVVVVDLVVLGLLGRARFL